MRVEGSSCYFDFTHLTDAVSGLVFSPDGIVIAAGNRYGTARVWLVATGKEVITFKDLKSEVWAIAYSLDRTTFAAADTDWKKPGTIRLYDTFTGNVRASLTHPAEILCLAFSPDTSELAASAIDGR